MSENRRRLKIGLDYHGVINDNPGYFSAFCAEIRTRGHRLYILTGGPADKVKGRLAAAGIAYDELFTIVDYYVALGHFHYMPDGSIYIDDKLWNRAKADFCRKHQIDVQIDDSLVYGEYFSTPYCLYNRGNKSCQLSLHGQEINLNGLSAAEAVNRSETILA